MFAIKNFLRVVNYRPCFVGLHSLSRVSGVRENALLPCLYFNQVRGKRKSFESLFKSDTDVPTPTKKPVSDSPKHLTPREINTILTDFIRKPEIRNLAADRGLNAKHLRLAFVRFRALCLSGSNLPVELEIVLSDIMVGAALPDDLFGQFMAFAMKIYPHIQCKEELSRICDLRDPAAWYPLARAAGRKIIFHAGPTNSGKTYHALEKFMEAKASVYCGPLKMLANEVYQKTREKGIDCDLATGDERVYCNPENVPCDRVSCTVEMAPLQEVFDVAIIDEIQMLQDPQRGWAWSRALLGIAAKEVHVCGEPAAIPLVRNLLATAGETVEIREYKRLTGLTIENSALQTLSNVRPGDCLVCFNKRDLFKITKELEALGHRVAVIYGSLPPGAKLMQCKKFNDDVDPCNVMVATDAIGMGLNLNIRRIIFVSLKKIDTKSDGKRSLESISVSQALQIAGRAGRFGTQYEQGHVTTLRDKDLNKLKSMLSSFPEPPEKAGLHPTAEQIEMFAYHLPDTSLQSILEIFTELSQMDDSLYFLCNIESFKFLAEKIDSLNLPLRARYTFCCAPVNIKDTIVVSMVLRMAREYSHNKVMTAQWLSRQIQWPPPVPSSIADMTKLESLHDVFDVYMWLSIRFPDLFQESSDVKKMKTTLDDIIVKGLDSLSRLMSNAGSDGAPYQVFNEMFEETSFRPPKVPNETKTERAYVNLTPGTLAHELVQSGNISLETLDRLKGNWAHNEMSSQKETQSDPDRSSTSAGEPGGLSLETLDRLKSEWKQELSKDEKK